MKERLIGGFFVATITLITLLSGGIVTAGILTVISILGVYELMKVYSLEKTPFAFLDYIATVGLYVLLYIQQERFIIPMIIFLILLLLTCYVVAFPKYKDTDVTGSIFAFLYAAVLLSFVFRVREMEGGMLLSFYILIASWGNDVFAYLVGRKIGKHKFSPKVSPNKSVEGFVGGIVGAALLGFVFGYAFTDGIPFSEGYCALIAAITAIPSVIGDLAASAIKRNHEIKDYSHLIPGHGGILDRFDSVFFAAPILYYLIVIVNTIQ